MGRSLEGPACLLARPKASSSLHHHQLHLHALCVCDSTFGTLAYTYLFLSVTPVRFLLVTEQHCLAANSSTLRYADSAWLLNACYWAALLQGLIPSAAACGETHVLGLNMSADGRQTLLYSTEAAGMTQDPCVTIPVGQQEIADRLCRLSKELCRPNLLA